MVPSSEFEAMDDQDPDVPVHIEQEPDDPADVPPDAVDAQAVIV